MQTTARDPRIRLALVGFSPPERLAPIARHLGWTGDVLGDEQRRLYTRLGLGRAPWWRIYTPATLRIYARNLRHLRRPPAAGEDTRQLGGDAVLLERTIIALWRPHSPDDRPPAAEVLTRAARELR